jgi:hypothetical protein
LNIARRQDGENSTTTALSNEDYRTVKLVCVGIGYRTNNNCADYKKIKESDNINTTYFEDNDTLFCNWRKGWLEFLKILYIRVFFHSKESTFSSDQVNCTMLNRDSTRGFTIDCIFNRCIDLFARSLVRQLFCGYTSIENKSNNESFLLLGCRGK